MMRYEKGEKISFGEAIKILENNKPVFCSNKLLYRVFNGVLKHSINGAEGSWIASDYTFADLFSAYWYTAKEVEEKFIPTKEELFGWWKHKDYNYVRKMPTTSTYAISDIIKKGWQPATEEDLNEFYKKVVEELKK